MDELTKQEKPNIISLGGQEYELPKLTHSIVEAIESEMDMGIITIAQQIVSGKQFITAMKLLSIILGEKDLMGKVDFKPANINEIAEIITAIVTFLNGD